MSRRASLGAALSLMRPAQWPILTIQLAVAAILGTQAFLGPEMDRWNGPAGWRLAAAWLSWVVLLNGGTLAYNSAYDRDTGPVAYLPRPPAPPRGLAGLALILMGLGALTGWVLVGRIFALLLSGCILLSVLYSHPRTRWKARPGLDLLINMVGYGAGSTLAGLSAASGDWPDPSGWWFTAGFGLLFGSFYPLTQIYQVTADRQRGDRTLTTALGVRRVLILALGLGLMAGLVLGLGCHVAGRARLVGWLVAAVALWCGHLVWWWRRAGQWDDARHERAMYTALGLWGVVDAALATVWLAG